MLTTTGSEKSEESRWSMDDVMASFDKVELLRFRAELRDEISARRKHETCDNM
jgi:hypothetical protein